MAKEMRNTTVLLICRTFITMKANLPQTEETWLKFWEDDNVFEKALEKRKNSPLFIYMMVLLMQWGYSLRDCS